MTRSLLHALAHQSEELTPRVASSTQSPPTALPPPLSEEARAEQSRLLSLSSTEEARKLVPLDIAEKLNILPLGVLPLFGREGVLVAAPEAQDSHIYTTLKFVTGREIRMIEADPSVIADARFRAYRGSDSVLESCVQREKGASRVSHPTPTIEFRPASSDAARILASLVDYGISKRASDIHLIPRESGMFLRIRIDGDMLTHDKALCSLAVHQQIVQRLKVLASLDTTAIGTPLDGAFSVPIPTGMAHIRVGIIATVHGERAVLRLACQREIPHLKDLGLHPILYSWIQDTIERGDGAILLAGPTGSGKTTTLYSILNHLGARNLSVVSVEDPVEVRLSSVSQTQIDPERGLTYPIALRSILRQDPDVILLGELRDSESATAALHAAITGHLLLSTVHARSPLDAILRLEHLGTKRATIAQSIRLIVCQQLVPALCRKCRVIDGPASHILRSSVYRATGCHECGQRGMRGRALAVEALRLTPEISDLVENGSPSRDLKCALSSENFLSLPRSAEKLLFDGIISCDVAEALTESSDF